MASRIVKKIKRLKNEPFIKTDIKEMKVRVNKTDVKENQSKMAEFNVNQLIAELSVNTKVPKGEIENIQRRLLQQANEILKVNAFANSQPVLDTQMTQKSQNKLVYAKLPNKVPNSLLADNQLVPEKLVETKGSMQRGPMPGRSTFLYQTGSAAAAASALQAPARGECLCLNKL